MFSRVLVPLDGSSLAEQVLPYVKILSKGLGGQVELLRVIEPSPSASLMDPAQETCWQRVPSGVDQDAEKYLTGVTSSLTGAGIQVSATVDHGDPASRIMATAEAPPGTLIAMSTHGKSGITRWALGSVANKVLHSTSNPLLMVRCCKDIVHPEIRLSAVIAPLDGSTLAQRILPHVARLANVMKIKADLVSVIPSVGQAPCRFEVLPASGDGPGWEVREQAKTYLDQAAEQLRRDGVSLVEGHVLQGHPAVAIIDYARSIPNSIVAMASHGRSGIGRWPLGSITDLVARNSEVPVLVVHTSEPASSKEK